MMVDMKITSGKNRSRNIDAKMNNGMTMMAVIYSDLFTSIINMLK